MRALKLWMCLILCGSMLSMWGCASQFKNNGYQSIAPKNPRITFVRNQNGYGSTVVTSIGINDWIVGTIGPGEHLTLEYPAGIHKVSVKDKTRPLALKHNREYFFLVLQNDDGSVSGIRPILAKDAAQYMESGIYHTGR